MTAHKPSRVVVSVHGAHALSGVSTWVSRLLASDAPRHNWNAIVAGTEEELSTMGSFPGEATGRVTRLAWDPAPRAAMRRVDTLRAAIARTGAEVVIPNYVPEAFAAAALDSAPTRRTLGVCHSRDAWYLELFQHAGPAIDAAWTVSSECTELIDSTLDPSTPRLEAPYATPLPSNAAPTPGVIDPDAPLRLLYLGRLDGMQKRVIRLADVADELHARDVPFNLRIAGDGPERERLSTRLAAHLHGGRAEMLGAVSPDRASRLLSDSDVLVLTSAYEGTPLAAIEAMAAARPVIATEGSGGACDALRRFGGGVVVPREDPAALAAAAEHYARDRSSLARASSDARSAAETLYSQETHARALDDLIDRAFDAPTASAARPREVWKVALRCAALAAERGQRDLGWRHRRAWGRDFIRATDTPKPLTLSRPGLSRTGARLLRSAVTDLERAGHTRIAVFPAGRHSRTHAHGLRTTASVSCFVDDHPTNATLHGKPILTPEQALKRGIDAIVISSDQHEPALTERARGWADGRPVATLYIPVRLPVLPNERVST